MKVSIFGLGYVGCVTAACLARQGHDIVGVDIIEEKVRAVNSGRWPIYEPGLDEILSRRGAGSIRATTDVRDALLATDVSLVCVGTPGLADGAVDLRYLTKTVGAIARILRSTRKKHTLLLRSTVPPGTCERHLLPLLPPSARTRTAFYPEFLREGTAIRDFFNPSLNVIGAAKGFPVAVVKRLLPDIPAPLSVVAIPTAETIKYANNTFHGLKIAFTNEFSRFCKSLGADPDQVMDLFCRDTKLNLSPYYMRPGFAFGGSCLPKELKAVIAISRARGGDAPLFEAILRSNDAMIASLVHLVLSLRPRRVGYVGVTFKPDTDDLRESAVLKAAEAVPSSARSYAAKILQYACDNPKALEKIRATSPAGLIAVDSLAELARVADVIVLGPRRLSAAEETLLVKSGRHVIDLKWFRVGRKLATSRRYHSLV